MPLTDKFYAVTFMCHREHYCKLMCIDMLDLNKANTPPFVKYATLYYARLNRQL
jgi:hypothetical protein